MTTIRPVVSWQDPNSEPEVEKYDMRLFWLAVKAKRGKGRGWKRYVYSAYYVNKPIELDSNGYPLDDDHFIDFDGEPLNAVGWHFKETHADFDGFYTKIDFNSDYVLLGWGEYLTPEPPKD